MFFGGGSKNNALERVEHFENILMTNLPRIATLENRMNDVCQQLQSLEARFSNESKPDDVDIHVADVASLAEPQTSLTASLAEEAPMWTGQIVATVNAEPGPAQPAPARLPAPAPPDDQAAIEALQDPATSIGRLTLLEKAVKSQYYHRVLLRSRQQNWPGQPQVSCRPNF